MLAPSTTHALQEVKQLKRVLGRSEDEAHSAQELSLFETIAAEVPSPNDMICFVFARAL
jgi:hypothetical protein